MFYSEFFQLNVDHLLLESSFYFTIVAHRELHYIFLSVQTKKKKKTLEKGKNRIQLSYYFLLCVYVCVRVLAVLPTEVWWWLKWECFPIGYKCCYFYLWEEGIHFYNLISPYALECKMFFRFFFFHLILLRDFKSAVWIWCRLKLEFLQK